jgi:predicted nucleic acid-binding protein
VSYLLDTCAISHLRRPVTSPANSWFSDKDQSLFYISVVTLGEIESGIARLEPSRKKRDLEEWFYGPFQERFSDRILPIDAAVAKAWGRLSAKLVSEGNNVGVQDLYIAATALVHSLAIITTNTKDFVATGVVVLNPWERAAPSGLT